MILTEGGTFLAGIILGFMLGMIVPFVVIGIIIYKSGYVKENNNG